MHRFLLTSLFVYLGAMLTTAAEVWAPGVSRSGGWYDYHKTGSNNGAMADTAMCWAASASNVISWWQNHNKASITSSVPQNGAIFDTFRTIFTNGGGKAAYAYEWWVTGEWNAPEGSGWASIDKAAAQNNPHLANGGFLRNVYDTLLNPISIISSSNNPYTYSEAVVKALQSGYALTLSTENSGVAHAYTLWGAEYKITNNGYELTSVWLTNSDDIYNEPAMFNQAVVCEYSAGKNQGTVHFDGNMGVTMTAVAGLRTALLSIPEPASATLTILALVGLAGKRRRH